MIPLTRKNQRGFSLIELLVAMVILSIAMIIVIRYFQDQQMTIGQQTAMSEVQQNQRAAMDKMIRDLRPTGQDARVTGQFGLVYGSIDTIVVTMDANGNGTLDSNQAANPDSFEIRGFRYAMSPNGGQLFTLVQGDRNLPGNQNAWVWQLAATNFDTGRACVIAYFDTTGAPVAVPPAITALRRIGLVRITLLGKSLNRVGSRRQYVRRELVSDVEFRNCY